MIDREGLVERMALAVANARRIRDGFRAFSAPSDMFPMVWKERLADARAALAVAEAEIIEACAGVAERIGTPLGPTSVDNEYANGYRTSGREIATAIRALKEKPNVEV